ncbi:hypothetical protein [Maricaulis salignorans]|uniref:Uncharacterized protein n=1 Tax=Maricaulis salignorans TaxID=144026 RepID=A0A1G9WNL8_9PROT|nr:hypothetical protein [Maricaulis salignorans]SDM86108.1 hypothetical protein SAMN04488568_12623 [Maricaulis salignorans]
MGKIETHDDPETAHGLRDATITALVLSLSFGGFLLADSVGEPIAGVDKLVPVIALILVVWGGIALQIILTRLWRKHFGRTER